MPSFEITKVKEQSDRTSRPGVIGQHRAITKCAPHPVQQLSNFHSGASLKPSASGCRYSSLPDHVYHVFGTGDSLYQVNNTVPAHNPTTGRHRSIHSSPPQYSKPNQTNFFAKPELRRLQIPTPNSDCLSPQYPPANNKYQLFEQESQQSMPGALELNGWVNMSPPPNNNNKDTRTPLPLCLEEDEDDDDEAPPSPSTDQTNKFPVEIEYHMSKKCNFQRQKTKSGYKLKQLVPPTTYDDNVLPHHSDVQHIKYYEKHLARVCHCKQYKPMSSALVSGLTEDKDGYEIHYSQKCKWKAYDDFKTGARVLIRLCKCYNPN